MMPWFIWNGQNSLADYGLWVSKLPKRIRPEERHDEIVIPGRAGSLIMLEGEDVYDSVPEEMTVIARNELNIDRIVNWLRGSGELVLSTDVNKSRKGRIVGKVAFERIGNSLQQAVIPFLLQPFRMSRYPNQDSFSLDSRQATATVTFPNPGDVAAWPVFTVSGSGNVTISCPGSGSFTLKSLSGTVTVDCGARMVTHVVSSQTVLWTGTMEGEFFKIPKGIDWQAISMTGNATATVQPNWRWM